MKTDIEIAQEAEIFEIKKVAENFGIDTEELELYGRYKAKLSNELYNRVKDGRKGKLVLVTAINPTPAGEGKTTTTIGLAQGLNKLGKKTIVALREPSLGPCMGIKGGAAGGGYAQVIPMEDINLHFTGDIHAMTAANNLLSAMIDNHLQQGNELGIDPKTITWKRALDMNDRALRNIIVGLGAKTDGVVREDSFQITVASEIMAIMCLAEDIKDLKERLARIIIGYSYSGEPVTAGDIKAQGAMAALLKDALKPNLVQTLEHTPAIIHCGPFANIAHGCNSVKATKIAMGLSDIAITEAGFGADLGAEKFLDIKCRFAGLKPDCVVLVATVRSLKYNGGVAKAKLNEPDIEAVKKGFVNLEKHIENLSLYGIPVVVTLNAFTSDTEEETEYIKEKCEAIGADFAVSEVWAKGGEGGLDLGRKVIEVLETKKSSFKPIYDVNAPIMDKIDIIATKIYGADGVDYSAAAKKDIARIEAIGYRDVPVCIAKTQYSLSDNAALLGRPEKFRISIRSVTISAGAGFAVALAGNIMTMPGLPKRPAAEQIDVTDDGEIVGLF